MASAPSAPALSAVLRCRGTLLSRNPPNTRSSSASYGLGHAAGGAVQRDFLAARTGSNRTLPACTNAGLRPAAEGREERGREEGKKEVKKCWKLSQASGRAHAAGTRTRTMTSVLLGREACTKIIHITRYQSRGARASVTCASVDLRGGAPTPGPPGWATLKRACASLSSLVSRPVLVKLLLRNSTCRAARARAPLHQEDGGHAPQTNGPIRTSQQDNLSSGRETTAGRSH